MGTLTTPSSSVGDSQAPAGPTRRLAASARATPAASVGLAAVTLSSALSRSSATDGRGAATAHSTITAVAIPARVGDIGPTPLAGRGGEPPAAHLRVPALPRAERQQRHAPSHPRRPSARAGGPGSAAEDRAPRGGPRLPGLPAHGRALAGGGRGAGLRLEGAPPPRPRQPQRDRPARGGLRDRAPRGPAGAVRGRRARDGRARGHADVPRGAAGARAAPDPARALPAAPWAVRILARLSRGFREGYENWTFSPE